MSPLYSFIVSSKRGSRERKEGRHREHHTWEEDGRVWVMDLEENWDIPFYRESSTTWESRAPFYEVTTAKHSALKAVNSESFPMPSLPPRSADGTKREGARETSASYYWNYGRSDARKSKFPRFFFHRIPCIVYDLLPAKRRRFRGVEEARGEVATPLWPTQGRPLADLGKANKCEGNRREEW